MDELVDLSLVLDEASILLSQLPLSIYELDEDHGTIFPT